MRSRIAGMCGAIFGACAMTVLSTLTISVAGGAHALRAASASSAQRIGAA